MNARGMYEKTCEMHKGENEEEGRGRRRRRIGHRGATVVLNII